MKRIITILGITGCFTLAAIGPRPVAHPSVAEAAQIGWAAGELFDSGAVGAAVGGGSGAVLARYGWRVGSKLGALTGGFLGAAIGGATGAL